TPTPPPAPAPRSCPVISKVTDYIFVGNLNAAYNGRTLCRNNIDSIIDMSSMPGDPGPSLSLIPYALGEGSPALKQHCFEDINECIEASTEKRKRVLVHCRDGYSLAPTCIIQYLMVKQNMRLISAYELLRAKYPVNIRECHQNVLVSLERALRPGGNVDPDEFVPILLVCTKSAVISKRFTRYG
uniref:protein-tyrosine-phosphatase n=1 Tax=Hucho hucho TaxID=62062 RepID=A0A4W5N743_9TELE